jgi:hypothetical protein
MAKKPFETEDIFPMPTEIQSVGKEIFMDDVNKTALRRGKVRELMRMGYEPHQMVLILDKGIRINKTDIVKVPATEAIMRVDMEYIRQEDAAVSIDFSEKRAALLDKLNFLYQRSVLEYTNGKGSIKNSFLNTALGVLSKIIEIEGIKSSEGSDTTVYAESKIVKFATEIQTLQKEDKDALITTIHTILAKRERKGVKGLGVSDDTSGVPTAPSNDAGVSGQS